MCRGDRWRGDSLGFVRDSLDESGSRDRGLLESSPECWRAPGRPGGLSAPWEAAAARPPRRGVARISMLEGVVDSSGRMAGAIGRGVATVSSRAELLFPRRMPAGLRGMNKTGGETR